jgi:hypothetical protein
MADPIGLTVLGSAASQTISFLYAQAAELLKARREHRRANAAASADLHVPIVPNEVLDRRITASMVDLMVLDAQHQLLVKLAGALAPYALGQTDIEDDDLELGENAGTLRALLEAIYGQRLTFRNEDREPSGSVVTVRQVLGEIEGTATGSAGDIGAGARLDVTQKADVIRAGGEITGHKGSIGRL